MKTLHAKGFSLLELLVVLAIITVLAGTAVVSLSDTTQQARFDVTDANFTSLQQAITGTRSFSKTNGLVSTNGYIADTGKKPISLSALVIFPDSSDILDIDGSGSLSVTEGILPWGPVGRNVDPESNGHGEEIESSEWEQSLSGGYPENLTLQYGWRGPYLTIPYTEIDHDNNDENNNLAIVYDGWGTEWSYTSSGEDIELFSLGRDQVAEGEGLDQDYPSPSRRIISAMNIQVDLAAVKLPTFELKSLVETDIYIGLIYPGINLNDPIDITSSKPHASLLEIKSGYSVTIPASSISNMEISNEGNFGDFPYAYRYQIAIYRVPSTAGKTLANQLIDVIPFEFSFAPTNNHMNPPFLPEIGVIEISPQL